MAKALMLEVSEEEIIPFPLMLSSPHVSIVSNHLTLNYSQDIRMHTHLLNCEPYLAKSLKIFDVSTMDWVLRSTVIEGIPKHLHLLLSKSLLNFAGAAHQLHRQMICSSSVC